MNPLRERVLGANGLFSGEGQRVENVSDLGKVEARIRFLEQELTAYKAGEKDVKGKNFEALQIKFEQTHAHNRDLLEKLKYFEKEVPKLQDKIKVMQAEVTCAKRDTAGANTEKDKAREELDVEKGKVAQLMKEVEELSEFKKAMEVVSENSEKKKSKSK